MKRLFAGILIAMSLLVCNDLAAQETVKHVVQKGETVASIAANYGVTPAEITSMNPKAERFLFVGMEIQIPVKNKPAASAPASSGTTSVNNAATVSATQQTKTPSYTSVTGKDNASYASAPYKNQTSSAASKSSTAMHFTAGYNLSLEEKPKDTTVWGVSVLLSVDEHLTDLFYVGFGAGLSFGGSKMEQDSYKATSTAYQLTFPLYFGITPIDGLDIDTGPSFNWLVGGGTKLIVDGKTVSESKYNDDKDLKRFSPTWRISARLAKCIHVGVNIGLKKDSGTSMTLRFSF